jgi:hypothetical protein
VEDREHGEPGDLIAGAVAANLGQMVHLGGRTRRRRM